MGSTVAAISSPSGGGQRGVIRISGPLAGDVLRGALVGEVELGPRSAFSARLDDGRGEQPCLVLWMPGPASYTREDVAELHLPGAAPLLAAALQRLADLGCVPAPRGEFTRRAFLNGRLDLTQAEGVLELVQATGEAERRAALGLLEGGLAERLGELREGLDDLRALAEASLDFDESDTGHVPNEELQGQALKLRDDLGQALAWEVRRQAPSALPRVVLVGAPNAGKSTLFNALVPQGRALVSPVGGSTRDGASGLWPLAGVDCLVLDAPGLDPTVGGADRTAQDLAARERRAADLWLVVVDGRAGRLPDLPAPAADDPPRIVVWNQVDRGDAAPAPTSALGVSALERTGLEALEAAAAGALGLTGPGRGGESPAREISARHRAALLDAAEHLDRARSLLGSPAGLDLVAEALRGSAQALDGIGGRTTAEDLLDRIFARFCLGK